MVAVRIGVRSVGPFRFFVPLNEKGEEDWTCPRCGGKMVSTDGNSRIFCPRCRYVFFDTALAAREIAGLVKSVESSIEYENGEPVLVIKIKMKTPGEQQHGAQA